MSFKFGNDIFVTFEMPRVAYTMIFQKITFPFYSVHLQSEVLAVLQGQFKANFCILGRIDTIEDIFWNKLTFSWPNPETFEAEVASIAEANTKINSHTDLARFFISFFMLLAASSLEHWLKIFYKSRENCRIHCI